MSVQHAPVSTAALLFRKLRAILMVIQPPKGTSTAPTALLRRCIAALFMHFMALFAFIATRLDMFVSKARYTTNANTSH